jgi:hypothetical protein
MPMKRSAVLALCLCLACESEPETPADQSNSERATARPDAASGDAGSSDAARPDAASGDAGESEENQSVSPDAAAASGKDALYVLATTISDDSAATGYVAVLGSLDIDQVDLSQAREFGGYSDVGVVGEWVFVSSDEAPVVKRFTVDAEHSLRDDGSVDFGNYTSNASFYSQKLVSPTKAYLVGEGELVIWNPSELAITGTLPFPAEVEAREGIAGFVALDRGAVTRGNRLYATLTWNDTEQMKMLPDSRIIVVDTDNDEIVDVLEAPCPDLSVADRDEAGNLFFSNWVYSPGATILNGSAPACAVRIAADSDQLDDWKFAYAEANGSEGAVVNYLGDGRLLFSSFRGTRDEYDPQTDEVFDWLFGDKWQLQVLDPSDNAVRDVSGIPKNGGGYYSARFEGTTHLLIPEEGYTSTSVYTLDDAGKATRKLRTKGWSTRLFKLR